MDSSHTEQGLLNAKAFVAWKRQAGALKYPVAPSKVIICPQLNSIVTRRQKLFGKKLKGIMGTHLCINEKTGLYLSGGWGVGGSGLVAVCEELHELGAKEFYLAGLSGRLTDELNEGDICIAHSAIREEGTSGHYLPTGFEKIVSSNYPDKNLAHKLGLKIQETIFASTDAPFRETAQKVNEWVAQGAKMVDMETASLYAFGRFYNIPVLSIGVAADSLSNGSWQMTKDFSAVKQRLSSVIENLVKILND